jgi:hypothetical protein
MANLVIYWNARYMALAFSHLDRLGVELLDPDAAIALERGLISPPRRLRRVGAPPMLGRRTRWPYGMQGHWSRPADLSRRGQHHDHRNRWNARSLPAGARILLSRRWTRGASHREDNALRFLSSHIARRPQRLGDYVRMYRGVLSGFNDGVRTATVAAAESHHRARAQG